ncbi:DNA-directed RNA polymerase III subunit RPC10 [Penicillium taxi]|uniref:DNA-directed RNA polymerase III subunit RPC10 n=1 Tax=Penicillium taxi TaxID=168475 RepID=UPI0025452953|nr:DNA-directed RNA polymerase III subunit RPC10 [Penicillium taxi]KAJ5909011.1 DNA-directed RNA polymerase III subunit RPC10 [Penicillium taxi]
MPLVFCPNCANALTVSRADSGLNRFECRTCPYEQIIDRKYYDKTLMKQKEVEAVFGGADEWKNADSVASKRSPIPREGWRYNYRT